MNAQQIKLFREKLNSDADNLKVRRELHEHYEWLEAYWRARYIGNNYIDKFDEEFGTFFWNIEQVREVAHDFAFYPPVGSSNNNFLPTTHINRATFYLRYNSNLIKPEFPGETGEKEIASQWKKSSFAALLTIVKQIRDNLFHGRKTEIEEPQYQRNKELVSLAVKFTGTVLDNLDNAEA